MSQVCCVEDCNHSRNKNKCTLKRFPTDSQKCKLWEDIIKREGWYRTSWDRICECHFSDEQFEQNRADGLRKLRWDAIPTLFGTNLRTAKVAAEEVVDKKDSEEAVEDVEDVEELEVEIEENSNSDEGSDVETYIVTEDLDKTIQVIKEKESPSTTRSLEKQSSESPTSGKTKTKRIVIRVSDGAPKADSVEEDVNMEEGERNVEDDRTTEECSSTENADVEVCGTGGTLENITEGNLDVEGLPEEETAECDSTENVAENFTEENTVAEVVETETTTEERLCAETNLQAIDTEMSEPQASEEPFKDEEVGNSSAENVLKPEHLQLTDRDLSQLKSDWKNPKLKARDVKIMAGGRSSRILHKKKHQIIESRAAYEVGVAERCQPASENLEHKCEDVSAVLEERSYDEVIREPADEPPVDSAPSQTEEIDVTSEVAEGQEPVVADSNGDVSGPREKVDVTSAPVGTDTNETAAPVETETDETIASIERRLEKIFSNEEQVAEDEQRDREESAANLNISQNEEDVSAQDEVTSEDVATLNQQEESGCHQLSSALETEDPNKPPENEAAPSENSTEEVPSVVINEGGEKNETDPDTSLIMSVNETPDNSLVEESADDSVKDDQTKLPEVSKEKSPKGAVKAGRKTIKDTPVSKTTEKVPQPKDAAPEKKKQESSPKKPKDSVSRRNRSSRDAPEESNRSSSRRDHSNHKESNRRTDNDPAKKPERVSRHNSHKDEKASPAKESSKVDEGKQNPDEESDKKQKKVPSPSKESKQPDKSSKAEAEMAAKSNTKTKEPLKELRSSKRCLISSAPPKRKQVVKEEEKPEDEEKVEDEEKTVPASKKAKVAEEASNAAQTKRRGRPPRGKLEERSSSEKAPPEDTKSLRHSKRTPKPSEKYKDSQSGKSQPEVSPEAEGSKRTQKRKLSSEDEEEESNRRSVRGTRSVKKRPRAASPSRKRQEVKNQDDEEEEDDGVGNARCICRVCGTEQQILLSIFGPEGTQLRLENKIHTHLPIRVRQHDKLPLGVCHSCVVTLSACDSLVDKCTQVDKRLRKMFKYPAEESPEVEAVVVRKEKPKSAPTEKAPDAPSQVREKATKHAAKSKSEQRSASPVKPVEEEPKTVRKTRTAAAVPAQPQEAPEPVVEDVPQEVHDEGNLNAEELDSNVEADIPPEMNADSREPYEEMDVAEQLAEAVQHDAILVKKEVMESEMTSPMKRFGNTYSTGRRTAIRAPETIDAAPQDRNSVIVIPPAETLRSTNNDVAPNSEEYILSMDEPVDDAPKTVIDSILDDWDEDEQERASTSANRVLTIKNNPDSEIVVTRLYNDEEEMLAEGESGEIIIQIHTNEFPAETREEPFWPAPDPSEETIIPDTEEQQNLTWKCGECGLRGKSVGNFLEHKKTHQFQEKKFFCSLCDKSFSTVEMLALHKKEKHFDEDDEDDDDDDDDELSIHSRKSKSLRELDIQEGGFYPGGNCKLYKCAQCDKMFGAAWSWKKHMEAHELDSSLADTRVHKCDICNRVFFDKPSFDDHKLTHSEGETPFQCSICDAKFATWNVFLTHVHTHKSSKTICKKCGREFGDSKTLREHMKEAHPVSNDKKFACHLCDKVCRKKIALTEHLRKHTGETPFECEICHKRFSRLANYRAHAAIHENLRRFACDVCGKRFNRQSIQQRHMKTHMRDTIKTSHVCRVCGEAFNKVNELLEHRLSHTRDDVERAYWMDVKLRGDIRDFTCKVCDVRFATVEAVLLHMPSHTDDERDIALKRKPKAYTCDVCHRTLWSKRTYLTHKQWHDEKLLACNQCNKTYATQTGLNYHMFIHTGERPFQCAFCEKCYKNKSDLRVHVRIHTGEYPYKCKFCPKAFRSPSSLIKHGDAHTEERPFKCRFCDQAFKRENTRANHERIHTNDKRFSCKYCNKGFIQKGACVKHEKWHENENKKSDDMSANPLEDEEENEDSLDLPEQSESGDSMDSYSMNMIEEHDVKEVDVVGLAIPSHSPQPIVAEPVNEANATAPSSVPDDDVHITLLG